MTRVEITKSAFGRLRVGYDCPSCGERLRSALSDAGKPDSCPNCHLQLLVPGTDELNREKQRKQSQENRRHADAKRKANAIQQERDENRRKREAIADARQEAKEEAKRQRQELENSRNAEPVDDPLDQPTEFKRSNRRVVLWCVVAIVAFAFVSIIYSISTKSGAGVTDIVRSAGLRSKLKNCSSYGIVIADAYYDGTISTDTVVFDLLDGGSATARRIDPVHLLLQFSDEIDLYSVRRVILARNGKQKFYISSSDLRPLAESYANGGRSWAFNNMPESARTMSGVRVYSEWSGGFLGVMQKQAEDLNDFIETWTGY